MLWSALRRATQDKRASFLGLGRVPRRGSQIPLHNLHETTQGAKGRPDTWAWLPAAEIPPGKHSFCLWFPSSGGKKGILIVSISYALGWASPPGAQRSGGDPAQQIGPPGQSPLQSHCHPGGGLVAAPLPRPSAVRPSDGLDLVPGSPRVRLDLTPCLWKCPPALTAPATGQMRGLQKAGSMAISLILCAYFLKLKYCFLMR